MQSSSQHASLRLHPQTAADTKERQLNAGLGEAVRAT